MSAFVGRSSQNISPSSLPWGVPLNFSKEANVLLPASKKKELSVCHQLLNLKVESFEKNAKEKEGGRGAFERQGPGSEGGGEREGKDPNESVEQGLREAQVDVAVGAAGHKAEQVGHVEVGHVVHLTLEEDLGS